MIKLIINDQPYEVDVAPDTPLLWVVREQLGLTGTKFGCGIAQCGACTVHVNGNPTRSCVLPVSAVEGLAITTIEGLSGDEALHPPAAGLDRRTGSPVRLLPVWAANVCSCTIGIFTQPQ